MDDNDVTDEDRQNWPADDTGDDNPMTSMRQDEELDEDDDPPFSPPDGVQDRIGVTDPRTDSNIDPQEHYDEGIEGATGSDMPGRAADEGETEPPLDDVKY